MPHSCDNPQESCAFLPATASTLAGVQGCCGPATGCTGFEFACINSADLSASCDNVCQKDSFTLKW